ncbi:MAG TPA: ATP-grasp domain-containing protein [Vicinamibacterales bacterium]|nr:ATP-grasp domain-containing protein [Vicinamibacterales bacterium]
MSSTAISAPGPAEALARRRTRALLCATTTGYQIRSFGDAAQKLGVRLVFASDRCDQLEDPWWDAAIPVRFHLEDAAVEAVRHSLASDPPSAVIAVGDQPVVVAARVAEAFGLPGHPPQAAAVSRDKLASRRALATAGLPTPSFRALRLDADAGRLAGEMRYPSVLKPLRLSGSRGVMRVDSPAGFVAGFDRLQQLLRSPELRAEGGEAHQLALIESFIPGAEFALEGILTRERLTVFAIFVKPDPLDGPFFEETIYVTPSRAGSAVQQAIAAQVEAAAQAIGLRHGPVHAECRVNAGGVYMIEVAARPIGGLCSAAVKLEDGNGVPASLEEVLLRHALGEDVSAFRRPAGASGVMMIPIPRRGVYKDVRGVESALEVAGVDGIRIAAKPDAMLVPLPEGRSYLGFIFASGETPDAVEAALREAHRRLQFRIDRELVVERSERSERSSERSERSDLT